MSWGQDFHFTVEPTPEADKFMPKGGWNDVISPWTAGSVAAQKPVEIPAYQSDENLKKQYGIELAKAANPYEAAKIVLGENDRAVWVSFNWLSDPIVNASKDAYLKTLALAQPPLDREQLAAKLLALADEKILTSHGVLVPTIEAKDRIAALKLYSEVLGYTGKVEIDNSSGKTTINQMTIKLVKAEQKPALDIVPNVKSEILNDKLPSPINLKLVKAG